MKKTENQRLSDAMSALAAQFDLSGEEVESIIRQKPMANLSISEKQENDILNYIQQEYCTTENFINTMSYD